MPPFLSLVLLLQPVSPPALPPLPSARQCAALFDMTYDTLRQKSGDPAMTAGFGEDAAALRRILIEQEAGGDEAKADGLIAAERARLAESHVSIETVDLKPCYRVKALGRGGE